jgi:predicted ATPase
MPTGLNVPDDCGACSRSELALGRNDDAISSLRRLIRRHPHREQLHRRLMVGLYRAGRQADALLAFREARHALVDELGIEPSADLRALHDSILAQEPVIGGNPPISSGETASSIDGLRSNLPVSLTRVFGRESELAELVQRFTGESRFISLTGAGGVGKTRLALTLAERLVGRFADGAFLVELGDVPSAHAVAGRIGELFGVAGGNEGLAAAMREREVLLVLDNFEHVLDAAPLVGMLLAEAPQLRVLVTTQVPLRIDGEEIYPLSPLELPQEGTVEALHSAAASALLLECAGRAASFSVDASSAPTIAELCRELDGSPLAIELAAPRLAVLNPTQLLERLQRSPDVLGRGGRDRPERQRGLRAALDWSYGLLDVDTATLLRRLGHFMGEVTLERLESVCASGIDDVVESLATLVEMSLVRRTGEGRFVLPGAVRTFARELAEDAGERETLYRRYAEVLEGELWQLAISRPLTSRPELRRAVDRERRDLFAFLEWAAENDLERFARVIALAIDGLHHHTQINAWAEPLDRAIAAGICTGRVGALLALAVQLARHRTGGFCEIALSSDTEGDDAFHAWLCGTTIAIDAIRQPGTGVPRVALELSARLAASPDPAVRDLARDLEGHLLMAAGRWSDAAAAYQATLQAARPTWVAEAAVYMQPDCYLHAGSPLDALPAYSRGLRAALSAGSRSNMAFMGEGIAACLAEMGRAEEALESLGASDTLTGEGYRPRDMMKGWGADLERRIGPARAQIGHDRAHLAYTRGSKLSVDAAVKYMLSLGEHQPRDVADT